MWLAKLGPETARGGEQIMCAKCLQGFVPGTESLVQPLLELSEPHAGTGDAMGL